MEILMDNVRQYILALKEAGSFSTNDIANLSGVPLETVKNILSGKTSKNAGFGTIAKLVISLGGDLNELIGYEKKKEIEVNSTVSLKETYEMRISDITSSYETRIEDIKVLCELRVSDVQKCCEIRISDMRKNYEERLEEQKQLLLLSNK
jgi:transcriptional regulator with XRE-family HTH domain